MGCQRKTCRKWVLSFHYGCFWNGNSGLSGLAASAIPLSWHALAFQVTGGLKWPKENFFFTLCWLGKVPTNPLYGAEVFLSQKFLILSQKQVENKTLETCWERENPFTSAIWFVGGYP